MRELDSRRCPSRVKGRPAIVKSLRALLLRTHRFGRHRARTADDIRWAGALVAALTSALAAAADIDTATRQGGAKYLRRESPETAQLLPLRKEI